MGRIYAILSVAGWAWTAFAAIYLFFRLRRRDATTAPVSDDPGKSDDR